MRLMRHHSFQTRCLSCYAPSIYPFAVLLLGNSISLSAGILEVVLVLLDHLLDHLSADGACLARGQIAVITVSKANADFACCLHLELVKCTLRLGN